MRGFLRIRVLVVLLASIATVIGLAPNASASYNSQAVVGPSWVPNNSVHSELLSVDGLTLYVGGDFTGNYAALDATTGALKWLGTADGDVRALAFGPTGDLLLGGAFTTVSGATHRKLAAVNPTNGAVDPLFKGVAGGTVRDMVVVGSTAYFGGAFTTHGGMTQNGLGAVDATSGALVTTFTTTTSTVTSTGTTPGTVYSLATDGTRLFFGGSFNTVSASPLVPGVTRNQLASVTIGSSTPDAWAPVKPCGGASLYWDLAVKGTRLYAVGRNCTTLMAIDTVTAAIKFRVTANGDTQALTLAPDGNVYVGGHFGTITVRGVTTARTIVAAFSVTNDVPTLLPFSARFVTTYPGVWGMASSSSRLYVAGYFTAAGPSGQDAHPYLAFFGV